MLTGITLENFKAFKEPQFIPIKPITLVFGPNSVGKSSIVHALAFLKHVYLTRGQCDPEEVDFGWSKVYLGSWQNLVHGHNSSSIMRVKLHSTRRSICWEFGNKNSTHGPKVLSFNIFEGDKPIARGTNTSNKGIKWEIEIHRSNPIIKSFKEGLLKLVLGKDSGHQIASDDLLSQYSKYFDDWNQNEWRFLRPEINENTESNLYPVALLQDSCTLESIFGEDESIWEDDDIPWFKSTISFEEKNDLVNQLLLTFKGSGDELAVGKIIDKLFSIYEIKDDSKTSFHEDLLTSHFHVGSHRELPQVDIREKNLPMMNQATVWKSLLEEKIFDPHGHPRIKSLNQAFAQLGIPYQISKRRRREIVYRPNTSGNEDDSIELDVSDEELVFVDQSGTTHPIRSLGSGVGFLVPVILALSTIDAKLISIEEPECHVHPGWQVALGDIIIQHTKRDCATDEAIFNGLQGIYADSMWQPNFVIETHSEHLILRILRRIRETTEGKLAEWPQSLRKACPNGILPEDVAVLSVQPGKAGVEIINMAITPDGDFSRPWPGGFFEERANEIF